MMAAAIDFLGCVLAKRQAVSHIGTPRVRGGSLGLSARKRRSSAANSPALEKRRAGLFSRHLRQMLFRALGTRRFRRPGGIAYSERTEARVSYVVSASNGGCWVKQA